MVHLRLWDTVADLARGGERMIMLSGGDWAICASRIATSIGSAINSSSLVRTPRTARIARAVRRAWSPRADTATSSGARADRVRLRWARRGVPRLLQDRVGMALLRAYERDATLTEKGGRVSRDPLREIDLHWHDLRHEGACRLLAEGVAMRRRDLAAGPRTSVGTFLAASPSTSHAVANSLRSRRGPLLLLVEQQSGLSRDVGPNQFCIRRRDVPAEARHAA